MKVQVKGSLISSFHEAPATTRVIAGAVLFFFSWMNVAPAAAAMKDGVKQELATGAIPPQADAANTLQNLLNARLSVIVGKAADYKARKQKADYLSDRKAIRDLQAQLKEQDRKTLQGFQDDLMHIEKYKLPDVIRQRHDEAQAKFEKEAVDLQEKLFAIQAADDKSISSLAQQLFAHLNSLKLKRTKAFDPKNLPFKVASGNVRKPKTTNKDLRDLLDPHLKVSGMALPVEERRQEIAKEEFALIEGGAKVGGPYQTAKEPVQVASIGALSGMLPVLTYMPPTASDLLPNEDVQITPAITSLAAQLNNNPVQIYNWVHDNVKYIPTYGVVQGGDQTLLLRRGNAFDISSLLIALLRASGVPARYVYGSIQIPSGQAMNWVGGVADAGAALQVLSQGGVPNTGLAMSGQIVAIQLEHVWVEAYVSERPGRGVKVSKPDSWVALDAAYKQFSYSYGMNLQADVPPDSTGFVNAIEQGATVDGTGVWIQNPNLASARSVLNQYSQNISNYVDGQNANPTANDVLGAASIVKSAATALPTGLPYRVVAAAAMSALPSSLEAQFKYNIYPDESSLESGSSILSYQSSTLALMGKKVMLIYTPSSSSDQQALQSYLPEKHADGSPWQLADFSSTLPGYGINLTPQLLVDGQVVATGGSFTIGTALVGQGSFSSPDLSGWDTTQDNLIVGETSALGLDMQGINKNQLGVLASDLEAIKAGLNSDGSGALSDLGNQGLAADLLTTVIWQYFVSIDAYDSVVQRVRNDVVSLPSLSYGFFHTLVTPKESYGVTTRVSFDGVLMDVSHMRRLTASKNSNSPAWIDYNRAFGAYASSQEALAPQQAFFGTSSMSGAVSTTAAIGLAASQGQKIFVITQDNQDQLAGLNQPDDVMSDIRNAISAGLEVTVPQTTISYQGTSIAGYAIVDPKTGAGAYLISNAAHGSQMFIAGLGLLALFLVAVEGIILSGGAIVIAPLLLAFLLSLALHVILISLIIGDISWKDIKGQVYSLISSVVGVTKLNGIEDGIRTVLSLLLNISQYFT